MNDELKPCPFCGGKHVRCRWNYMGDGFKYREIHCNDCSATLTKYSEYVEGDIELYILWNTRADDALISEKPAQSLKESTEDTQALTDSREKLLDYIWREITTTLINNGRLHDPNFWYANIVSWLDRQSAITKRELCAKCDWPSVAAQPDTEAYDRIKELTAERDELQSIIDHMPKTEAECEACQDAHDRLMFNAKVHQDELRDKLHEKQLVIDRQRDSFAKMERECAELRRMLADAADAI